MHVIVWAHWLAHLLSRESNLPMNDAICTALEAGAQSWGRASEIGHTGALADIAALSFLIAPVAGALQRRWAWKLRHPKSFRTQSTSPSHSLTATDSSSIRAPGLQSQCCAWGCVTARPRCASERCHWPCSNASSRSTPCRCSCALCPRPQPWCRKCLGADPCAVAGTSELLRS